MTKQEKISYLQQKLSNLQSSLLATQQMTEQEAAIHDGETRRIMHEQCRVRREEICIEVMLLQAEITLALG